MTLAPFMVAEPEYVFIAHSAKEALSRLRGAEAAHLFVVDGDRIVGTIAKDKLRSYEYEGGEALRRGVQALIDPTSFYTSLDCDPHDLLAMMRRADKALAAVVNERFDVVGVVERERLALAPPEAMAQQRRSCSAKSKISGTGTVERGARGSLLRVYAEKPRPQAEEHEADAITRPPGEE